jgi:indole-3-glycerol phosphate synthase/phosphoribosylanthranilate isomerase
VQALLAERLVDAVQLHGAEAPEACAALAFPYYKAVRMREPADAAALRAFRCPRVLVDAYSPDAAGGTGRRVPVALARAAAEAGPLWLAGGLGPDNVAEALRELSPELIDASSGLEESPGRKSTEKLTRYFKEIDRHGEV